MKLDQLTESVLNNAVALEISGDCEVCVFLRNNENSLEEKRLQFNPFIFICDPAILEGSGLDFEFYELSGDAPLKYIAAFKGIKDYRHAGKFLKKSTGANSSVYNRKYRIITDLQQQTMISKNIRLFRGMNFRKVRRMQFDIETLCAEGYDFSNPDRDEDKIVIITLSDNTGWEKCLSVDDSNEKTILQDFVEIVNKRNPDILEGHNIFKFDLPYIEKRAKKHKVKLSLGRNNSIIKKRNSRFNIAERKVSYTRYDIFGRHLIDTFHLTQFYDVIHRNLENYSLKTVAKHFGVAPENRVYIDGDQISKAWTDDRENLLKYAMDDVRETAKIAEILSPSYFYQTQIIPLSYQNSVVRGNASRIESMLISAYHGKKQSIPVAEQAKSFSGGLSKAFKSGVFENIWHCDIRSLYPSIILSEKWNPKRDKAEVFSDMLDKLRTFRLEAKDAAKNASDNALRDYYTAIQGTFKILINSFYGYLGFSQGAFNDFALADAVTNRGRELLNLMLNFLEKQNAIPIEMDTDGIYFQPPEGLDDTEIFEQKIQSVLPDGIEVELDETFKAMLCYKSKNYALLSNDEEEVSIKGAALKSRGLEPFQRDYMKKLIFHILKKDFDSAVKLYDKYTELLSKHKLTVAKFAKTETLNDSPENYRKKLKNKKTRRSASYELALKSNLNYRSGDQIAFYVTGNKKNVTVAEAAKTLADNNGERDENIQYYLEKLNKLHRKFENFIPDKKKQNTHSQPSLF